MSQCAVFPDQTDLLLLGGIAVYGLYVFLKLRFADYLSPQGRNIHDGPIRVFLRRAEKNLGRWFLFLPFVALIGFELFYRLSCFKGTPG